MLRIFWNHHPLDISHQKLKTENSLAPLKILIHNHQTQPFNDCIYPIELIPQKIELEMVHNETIVFLQASSANQQK